MFVRKKEVLFAILTLLVFFLGGLFLGWTGVHESLERARSTRVRILTENPELFPKEIQKELETELGLMFEVQATSDADAFFEKAPEADLLWARADWIRASELHLREFKTTSPEVLKRLVTMISADFFDPESDSATMVPLLWTLPLLRLKNGQPSPTSDAELSHLTGKSDWSWGELEDYFPLAIKSSPDTAIRWWLTSSSLQSQDTENFGGLWFPKEKLRPLVFHLAFVDNDRLSARIQEKIVFAMTDPERWARLTVLTRLSTTSVQIEERLPVWQRVSSLRKVGLSHLKRP